MERFYREVASILQKAFNKESSLKTLIYSSKFKVSFNILQTFSIFLNIFIFL